MRALLTDYESSLAEIQAVRIAVFVEEQQLTRETEFDDRDPVATHVVVFNEKSPVGTGRIDVEQDGRIGRVSVLRQHRRRGVGALVMKTLEGFAKGEGLSRLWFHAQVEAVLFYRQLGYEVSGSEFVEEGIPHVVMQKALR
jgi:predicted GNAT family N-acyltransferase